MHAYRDKQVTSQPKGNRGQGHIEEDWRRQSRAHTYIHKNDKHVSHLTCTHPCIPTEASELLRGKRGTEVKVTLERTGEDKPLEKTLVRRQVPIRDVPVALFLDEKV
jgi:hypothetical protein